MNRAIAVACVAFATLAQDCPREPWGLRSLTPAPGPTVYFDSGAAVRLHLANGDVITGTLATSYTPGGDHLLIAGRAVALNDVQRITIPSSAALEGGIFGYYGGGIVGISKGYLSHKKDNDKLVVAIGVGSLVGMAIGSRFTRWLTLAERTGHGDLVWKPSRAFLIPGPGIGDQFLTTCDSGVVAVGDSPDGGPFLTELQRAWTIDTMEHRLVPRPVTGVRCRSESWQTPLRVAMAERERDALTFAPSSGKARIYVAQRAMVYAAYPQFEIAVDGHPVGATSPGAFRMIEVEPGPHEIAVTSHGEKTISLVAAADSNYFLRVLAKRRFSGWKIGSLDRVSDAAAGRRMILAAQLVQP